MKNKELVFNIIKKSSKNLTAYEILEKLQKIKKTQPMTVYRALDHLHDKNHNTAIAICKKCGDTDEFKSDIFSEFFKKYNLKKYNFNKFKMEVLTTCKECN